MKNEKWKVDRKADPNGDVLLLFSQIQKEYLRYCYASIQGEPVRMTDMICIMFLHEERNNGKDTANEIARRYQMSRSLVSKSVDELRAAGYLTTLREEKDSRKVHLKLTEKCGPMVERLQKAHDIFVARATEGFEKQDLAAMQSIAARLRENLERFHREEGKGGSAGTLLG